MFPPELYAYPDDAILERWRTVEGRVFVAERAGRAVGLAAAHAGWLNGLYVLPEEWGSGVALALHAAAVAELAREHATAKLWVLEANGRARRFYERHGWRENGEKRVVPFPPRPLDVGYSLDLSAASDASCNATR